MTHPCPDRVVFRDNHVTARHTMCNKITNLMLRRIAFQIVFENQEYIPT